MNRGEIKNQVGKRVRVGIFPHTYGVLRTITANGKAIIDPQRIPEGMEESKVWPNFGTTPTMMDAEQLERRQP